MQKVLGSTPSWSQNVNFSLLNRRVKKRLICQGLPGWGLSCPISTGGLWDLHSLVPKLGRSLGTSLGLACVCDMPTEGDTVHVDDVHDNMELIASCCECMGAVPTL